MTAPEPQDSSWAPVPGGQLVTVARNVSTRYSGATGGPAFASAFLAGSSGRFEDPVAANATGIDAERWSAVN